MEASDSSPAKRPKVEVKQEGSDTSDLDNMDWDSWNGWDEWDTFASPGTSTSGQDDAPDCFLAPKGDSDLDERGVSSWKPLVNCDFRKLYAAFQQDEWQGDEFFKKEASTSEYTEKLSGYNAADRLTQHKILEVRSLRSVCEAAHFVIDAWLQPLKESAPWSEIPFSILPRLLAFVRCSFHLSIDDYELLNERLRKIPLHSEAEIVYRNSVKRLVGQEATPWAILATQFVLMSLEPGEAALRIRDALRVLCEEPAEWAWQVQQCLYLLASLLLAGSRKFGISDRLAYSLVAGLRLEASEACKPRPSGIRLTPEQLRLVKYPLAKARPGIKGETLRVMAFAGTGKTTTLEEIVRHNSELKFLYLVFNKEIQRQTERRMTTRSFTNVAVKTIHSLAYGSILEGSSERLGPLLTRPHGRPQSEIEEYQVRAFLEHRNPANFADLSLGHQRSLSSLVAQTLKFFCEAPDDHLHIGIVPTESLVKVDLIDEFGLPTTRSASQQIPESRRRLVLDLAKSYWDAASSLSNRDPRAQVSFDGIAKVFFASRKRLDSEFDAILIDEAQDSNPAFIQYLMNQPDHLHLIFVGDSAQAIYQFRGTKDALKSVLQGRPETKTFWLTQSFRFGPRIAHLANAWLWKYCQERRRFLHGGPRESSLDGTVKVGHPLVVIARTNLGLIQASLRCTSLEPMPKLKFLGSLAEGIADRLHQIKIYLSLMRGDRELFSRLAMKSEKQRLFYMRFMGDSASLVSYAKITGGVKMMTEVEAAKETTLAAVEKLQAMVGRRSSHDEQPDLLFGTVHATKGCEYENVALAGDFFNPARAQVGEEDDTCELNSLYVAVTRAKSSLILNQALRDLIHGSLSDGFTCLTSRRPELVCDVCGKPGVGVEDGELVVYRPCLAFTRTCGDVQKPSLEGNKSVCLPCAMDQPPQNRTTMALLGLLNPQLPTGDYLNRSDVSDCPFSP